MVSVTKEKPLKIYFMLHMKKVLRRNKDDPELSSDQLLNVEPRKNGHRILLRAWLVGNPCWMPQMSWKGKTPG